MSSLTTLMVLVPLLPLAAAIATALLGPRVLRNHSHWLVVVAIAASFLASCGILLEVGQLPGGPTAAAAPTGHEQVQTLWSWALIPDAQLAPPYALTDPDQPASPPLDFAVDVTLRADALTAIMLVTVTFVSMLVAIYSIGYMSGDRGYWRFFSLIGLFVFSMTMLVSVSNFVLLYVFWEAVGVCSYLLIGFWYPRPSAAAAGKKAFLVNRVGDFGFALGIFLLWTTYGTVNFHDADGVGGILGQARLSLPLATAYAGGGLGFAIGGLLFLGACGKSAQFPLHVWLPDAMEGPTPVSALIHAATMVTAGVYMVVRCTPLFFASPHAQCLVAFIGGFTALLAGLIALTQHDLKRVLAYSTVSQLGYMFLALGTGSTMGIVAGMFHLFTHAFFKALLFLGAGSVMHAMGNVIDMRLFGGLRRLLPITCLTFLVGCLALAGIWPFAGFYSKDMILAAVHERAAAGDFLLAGQLPLFTLLFWAATFTAFLTAVYTFRAFFRTFFGPPQVPPEAGDHAHESPPVMTIPLLILAGLAALIGWLMEKTHGFVDFLVLTPSLAFAGLRETTPVSFHPQIAVTSTLVAVAGIAVAAYFFLGDSRQSAWVAAALGPLYRASSAKFLCDEIYAWLIVWPLRGVAWLSSQVDR
ncbi:MAG: NADH-quinone oxidoreductase subunit L, partial [Planctomycetales bacterium]|nr:NADH-quinone oxidoreductase subunit L [Planctomycetales bacterium]